MNKEIWESHDYLVKETPERSYYWGLYKAKEEAIEWTCTDPDINEDQFLDEGADLIISYMTTMKSAGYSYEVACEAIMAKLNVVIDRAIDTTAETESNGKSWDENYLEVKKRGDIYSAPPEDTGIF